jgi:hypothetical protein
MEPKLSRMISLRTDVGLYELVRKTSRLKRITIRELIIGYIRQGIRDDYQVNDKK